MQVLLQEQQQRNTRLNQNGQPNQTSAASPPSVNAMLQMQAGAIHSEIPIRNGTPVRSISQMGQPGGLGQPSPLAAANTGAAAAGMQHTSPSVSSTAPAFPPTPPMLSATSAMKASVAPA